MPKNAARSLRRTPGGPATAPASPPGPRAARAPEGIDRWDLLAGGSIALLAFAARLVYIRQITSAGLGAYLRLDPLYYHEWGRRIAAGDWLGHDVFEMSPGYAYVLGILYRLFGDGQTLPRILQAALGAIVCALLVHVGRRAFGKTEGILAGAIFALYGPAIFYDGQVMKTSLEISCTALMTFAFFAAAHGRGAPRPGWVFAGGVLLGLTALMRENILVAAPILFAWLLWPRAGQTWGARLLGAAALVAGTLLPILPFTIRNMAVAHQTVLITSLGGENFYTGNNEIASGRYTPPPFVRPDPEYEHEDFRLEAARRAGRPLTREEVSSFWYHEGMRFIASHPLRWLWLLWDKLDVFLNDFERPDNFSFYNFRRFSTLLALPLPHLVWVAPLGIVGIALTAARWRELMPLYITLFAFLASALVFFTQARYRMPAIPILALFASAAAVALVRAASERRWYVLAAGGAAAILLALFVTRDPGNSAHFDAQNRSLVAEMHLAAGRLPEAAAEYRGAIADLERLPISEETTGGRRVLAGAHLGLGRVLLKMHDDAAAARELMRAAESPREDVRFAAWSLLGALHAEHDALEASAEAFGRAVEARPDDFDTRMLHAEALERIGALPQALSEVQEALRLRPTDEEAARVRDLLSGEIGAGRVPRGD